MGLQYSLESRQNIQGIPDLTRERLESALTTAAKNAEAQIPAKGGKKKSANTLRRSLAISMMEIPPVLVDHVFDLYKFDASKRPAEILENPTLVEELHKSLLQARQIVDGITKTDVCNGYIFATRKSDPDDKEEAQVPIRESLIYDEFHPFKPNDLENDPQTHVLEFKGYNRTLDEFFSSLEGQKLEARLTERETTAQKRLDAAKQDQAKRIEGLQEVQSLNFRKAAAIEANHERVQEAIEAVNGLISQGMDWVNIGKLIEREIKRHNPVAEIIKTPLKLADNIITLMLAEENATQDEEDDPYETDDSESSHEEDNLEQTSDKAKLPTSGLSVDINLGLSPWSNAREYYEQRRFAVVKEEKTQVQSARALKNTEERINQDLKKGLKQEKALLQPVRQLMWFEKFIWFISSDGYLVIGGKDATQNEIIYKRYLRKGDIYCHADIHGASTVVVKNLAGAADAPIPPSTLAQAGSLSVCTSDAWDSKAGMGAWWVDANQVSKSTSTGDFLPVGNFAIQGKKNFLPPSQLLLGLGIVFRISEESKAKHLKHRLHEDKHGGNSGLDPGSSGHGVDAPQPTDEDGTVGEDDDSETEDMSESGSDDGGNDQRQHNPLHGNDWTSAEEETEEVTDEVSQLAIRDDTENLKGDEDDHEEAGNTGGSEEIENAERVEVVDASLESASVLPTDSAKSTAGSTGKQAAPKRGQKGKAKKIANKYKDQDEEDRAAAEGLIGARAGQERIEAEAKAKADRQAEQEALKVRRRAQHEKQQKDIAAHEEVRRTMMEEGVDDMLDSYEVEAATSLDSLVGTSLPGDEILEAIAVCAPWNALAKYKFKVKIQPGAMKKGKAVKEVLERWKNAAAKKGVVDEKAEDKEKMWPREVELLKAMRPEDVINVVPVGKVRVVAAGGLAAAGGGGGGGGNAKKGGSKAGRGGRGGKGSKRS